MPLGLPLVIGCSSISFRFDDEHVKGYRGREGQPWPGSSGAITLELVTRLGASEHRDWVFHTAGGGSCRGSVENSRSRRSSWSENAGYRQHRLHVTWTSTRMSCASGEGVRL